ncbi:40s ribosomal protein s17 [Stylonychia lemnae]|uniref:40s ribosomal protein s17 n=1 Tax=Stylonychia lemnae TaxID=5949 RepID=A0A078A7J1_STYLE|nr:40s ribosomal protein s17 [Stylonychia lemnae]|eukprot:CDW78220.1 40s ribosomal protein s17 [Stylonychia lemnae]
MVSYLYLANHVYREEQEPRLLREHQRPSSRDTTESNIIFKLIPLRLTNDFHTNKRIIDDIAIIQSKRLRNKIAGFTTHMMKRIQKGPVKGISLKLQEEERERKMDFIPERSELQVENLEIKDSVVRQMVQELGLRKLLPGRKQKE